MSAYFTWKLGWLKTSAGTNMGPQNNMYLSAPDFPGYHFITKQTLISLLVTTQAHSSCFQLFTQLSLHNMKFVHISSIIDFIHHIIFLLYYSFFGSNSQNHSKKYSHWINLHWDVFLLTR